MSYSSKFVQMQATTLAGSGASIGDTSIILSSLTDPDGNLLTMTDFGSKGYGTIEPNGGSQEESISFTGITQNANGTATLTGVKHVLFIYPYTESSGITKSHAGGVVFAISDTAALWNSLVAYIDGIAIAGAPDATTILQGLVQLGTTSQINAGTAIGSTGATLAVTPDQLIASIYYTQLPSSGQKDALAGTSGTPSSSNKYVTNADTAETGNSVIVRTKSTGLLDSSIIPVSSIKKGTTTKDISSTSDTVIAHGLGTTPTLVRIIATQAGATMGITLAEYSNSTQVAIYEGIQIPSDTASGAAFRIYGRIDSSLYTTGTMTVDATNITISWSKTGSPTGTSYLIWEVFK